MKKNILLCVLHLLMMSGLFAQNTVNIAGKIANAKQDSIAIQFYPPLSNSSKVYKSKIDKQGSFSFNFSVPSCMIAYLGNFQLFISPNDNFSIAYDAAKQDEMPIFTGGKGAKENAFFVEMNKTLSLRSLYKRMNNATPEAFLQFADSLADAQLKKYEEAAQSTKFSENFDFHFKNYVIYGVAHAKLYAGSYMRYFQPDKQIEIPAHYYNFLAQTKLQADSLIDNPYYQEFVSSYISNRYEFLKKEAQIKTYSKDYVKEQYQLANMLLSGKVSDFVRAKIIKDGLQYAEWQKAEQLYHEEKTNFPQSKFLASLTEIYEELKRLAPGQPAPLFTLKDIEGKEVSLSDFKGKVVYLDIWASWCGPCIAEIPHAKKLKERMKGKDIVFLYVTIDENEKAWRDMVKNKEMEGVHLISEGGWASKINKLYGVNAVPTYFLIGKDGKIFNNRPPRPSSPEIDKELERALAEQ